MDLRNTLSIPEMWFHLAREMLLLHLLGNRVYVLSSSLLLDIFLLSMGTNELWWLIYTQIHLKFKNPKLKMH